MAGWANGLFAVNLIVDGPADRDWGMRTVSFVDPAGYTWSVAQDLP